MKKSVKRLLFVLSALLLLGTLSGIPYVSAEDSTKLVITSTQVMIIDETNSNQVNFYTDATKTTLTGSIQVKLMNSPNSLTPTEDGGGIMYEIDTGSITEVVVEFQPNSSNNYRVPNVYTFQSNQIPLTGSCVSLTLTGGIQSSLDISFAENSPDPLPMAGYPVTAKFDVPGGNPIAVSQNEDGYIVIPESWTSGMVSFSAGIFTYNNGTVEPFTGQTSGGTRSSVALEIEGIVNNDEIYRTVTGSADRKTVTIKEGFSEYGKLQLHLVSEPESDVQINQLLTVIHRDLITVTAHAPIPTSLSFGARARDAAIITKDEAKNVEVFYGNTEVLLVVNGLTVDKITDVQGSSVKSVSLNNDGSANVVLPDLSTETNTPVLITIRKTDGSTITRSINIVRAAVRLAVLSNDGKYSVAAGYEINKGYLYNNQEHNDDVFDAYLQVILYKGNVVAGYKQIQIDDAETVNSLVNDDSGSMELYGPNQIVVYGEGAGNYIEGVDKVSVFLTNGPIDFNSAALPSVEFGSGSGVTVEFGGVTVD